MVWLVLGFYTDRIGKFLAVHPGKRSASRAEKSPAK